MVKKLVACGIAASLAATLWSTIPGASRKVVKQVRGMEITYRAALKLGEPEP